MESKVEELNLYKFIKAGRSISDDILDGIDTSPITVPEEVGSVVVTTGFIYIWKNIKENKFYIGSHLGTFNDGYIGSGLLFKPAYQNSPSSFRRRILEKNIPKKDLLIREEKWLSLIKDSDLGKKYYNLKKIAEGGDIVSTLSKEKRQQHKEKSIKARTQGWKKWATKENLSKAAKKRRSKWTEKTCKQHGQKLSKVAIITYPNGNKEYIKNIAEFCRKNKIDYGNMKTVLRGNGKAKSCQGFRGYYV